MSQTEAASLLSPIACVNCGATKKERRRRRRPTKPTAAGFPLLPTLRRFDWSEFLIKLSDSAGGSSTCGQTREWLILCALNSKWDCNNGGCPPLAKGFLHTGRKEPLASILHGFCFIVQRI
ncbi:hypothetical protein GUJ93_ZPchr0012g18814 [Zizania palustris]|uniref:Uncharacterized protein n=1 Tax=Zizania palustris TaxID=103762 RepID=A0A8J6BVW6_ZIZPA|nr:hypothetical protein GUJ93_ZPchr0012g18814 [Zizania palustris]